MSLRRRLVLGFLLVAVVLVIADVVVISTVRTSLTAQIDRRLDSAVPGFLRPGGLARNVDPLGPPPQTGDAATDPGALSELFIELRDLTTGATTRVADGVGTNQPSPMVSAATVQAHLPRPGATSEPFTVGSEGDPGSHWRMTVALDNDGRRVVLAGLPLGATESTFNRITVLTLAATGTVLLALALAGWWVVRLGIRPIDELAATADAVAEGDLSRRIGPGPPGTEAGRLAVAFNGMVHQIEGAFAERQASEDQLRRFVADASHELRTPLTSIRGYTELYRSGALHDGEEVGDALRRIEAEATRMGGLVDDLLVLARLDQGRPLGAEPVDLVPLARDAVADARAVEPDRPIDLVCGVHAAMVVGDEARLRQVMANLLANTRVHTPSDAAVDISLELVAGRVRFTVADHGPGMSPEALEHVFERFYRADSSRSRDHGGSGLGLSIVAAVVAAHGGSVRASSPPGGGAVFVIELPGAVTAAATATPALEPEVSGS